MGQVVEGLLSRSTAGSGEPWQLLGQRNATTPHTKFYCALKGEHIMMIVIPKSRGKTEHGFRVWAIPECLGRAR